VWIADGSNSLPVPATVRPNPAIQSIQQPGTAGGEGVKKMQNAKAEVQSAKRRVQNEDEFCCRLWFSFCTLRSEFCANLT
jgi:hypothetical protein